MENVSTQIATVILFHAERIAFNGVLNELFSPDVYNLSHSAESSYLHWHLDIIHLLLV